MRITRVNLLALWCLQVVTTLTVNAATTDSSDRSQRERDGMVWIASGTFYMGCEQASIKDAKPVHQVFVDGFWMDKTEVTNKEFARFVRATGYQTVAERQQDIKLIDNNPNEPPLHLKPGAMVFMPPKGAVSKQNHWDWWHYILGANWQHPEGPHSNLKGRFNYPVVEIGWEDANEYAKWAKKRLPTEAEFEYAARGGLDRQPFSWGAEVKLHGRWQCNIWQGVFPYKNTGEDGFVGTAPVRSFPPNGFGLYDITGNVWEWCADWYRPNYLGLNSKFGVSNPSGPDDSFDPSEPRVPKKVLRGGSFLCTSQYCSRYLVGARGKSDWKGACCNIGFRCVRDSTD